MDSVGGSVSAVSMGVSSLETMAGSTTVVSISTASRLLVSALGSFVSSCSAPKVSTNALLSLTASKSSQFPQYDGPPSGNRIQKKSGYSIAGKPDTASSVCRNSFCSAPSNTSYEIWALLRAVKAKSCRDLVLRCIAVDEINTTSLRRHAFVVSDCGGVLGSSSTVASSSVLLTCKSTSSSSAQPFCVSGSVSPDGGDCISSLVDSTTEVTCSILEAVASSDDVCSATIPPFGCGEVMSAGSSGVVLFGTSVVSDCMASRLKNDAAAVPLGVLAVCCATREDIETKCSLQSNFYNIPLPK